MVSLLKEAIPSINSRVCIFQTLSVPKLRTVAVSAYHWGSVAFQPQIFQKLPLDLGQTCSLARQSTRPLRHGHGHDINPHTTPYDDQASTRLQEPKVMALARQKSN
jgi:hypothetical protein